MEKLSLTETQCGIFEEYGVFITDIFLRLVDTEFNGRYDRFYKFYTDSCIIPDGLKEFYPKAKAYPDVSQFESIRSMNRDTCTDGNSPEDIMIDKKLCDVPVFNCENIYQYLLEIELQEFTSSKYERLKYVLNHPHLGGYAGELNKEYRGRQMNAFNEIYNALNIEEKARLAENAKINLIENKGGFAYICGLLFYSSIDPIEYWPNITERYIRQNKEQRGQRILHVFQNLSLSIGTWTCSMELFKYLYKKKNAFIEIDEGMLWAEMIERFGNCMDDPQRIHEITDKYLETVPHNNKYLHRINYIKHLRQDGGSNLKPEKQNEKWKNIPVSEWLEILKTAPKPSPEPKTSYPIAKDLNLLHILVGFGVLSGVILIVLLIRRRKRQV